jgi:CheY-like chemotaxis protein
VLIVDDDEGHRGEVHDVLNEEGYDVVEAVNGKEALDYLVSIRDRVPDAILLDLSMPVMSGWELLAILKAYVRLANIPVILLSGAEPLLDPVRHGAIAAYLRKPYDTRTLLATMARYTRPAAVVTS